MDRRTRIIFATALVAMLLGSLAVASCGSGQGEDVAPASGQEQVSTPTLDGQSLVQERCTKCHNLERVQQARKTSEEWKTTVDRMVDKGAELNPAEQEAVIQYLAETYPK